MVWLAYCMAFRHRLPRVSSYLQLAQSNPRYCYVEPSLVRIVLSNLNLEKSQMSVRVGRDRTRRRGKSRLRIALEEQAGAMLEDAFKGQGEAEKVLIGHKRRIEDIDSDVAKLDRDAARERADLAKGIEDTDKQLAYENERLRLLTKRRDDLAKDGKPTEVVEGEIVTSTRRSFDLQSSKAHLEQQKSRIDEDLAEQLREKNREREQVLEDTQRRLHEAG